MRYWFVVLASLVGLIISGAFAITTSVNVMRQVRSTEFAMTEGVMELSTVRTKTSRKNRKSYEWDVKYSYSVGGRQYTSSKHSFARRFASTTREWVDLKMASHPQGAYVPVYYDRDNPSQAVLVQGATWREFTLPSFAMAFVLGSLLGGIYGAQRILIRDGAATAGGCRLWCFRIGSACRSPS